MSVKKLRIENFRNLSKIDLDLHPEFNVFYGENGSGKTSLLEAIYFSTMGRSFRTSKIERIFQYEANNFSVYLELDQGDRTIPLGHQRSRDGGKIFRMDGEALRSVAPLAKKLPIQLISASTYRLFCDGPKTRRQFLDWGVFHVEQSFYPAWQAFQRALKQRNAALKSKAPLSEVSSWDIELCNSAEAIDSLRLAYVEALQPVFTAAIQLLLPKYTLELRYERGWSPDSRLVTQLEDNYYRDRAIGYTQLGPQRADLQLCHQDVPVQDALSQGQQKLAAYALLLAQGQLLKQQQNIAATYLIDDLPSELDPDKQLLLLQALAQLESQVFVTGITRESMQKMAELRDSKLFHVEHGEIHAKNSLET